MYLLELQGLHLETVPPMLQSSTNSLVDDSVPLTGKAQTPHGTPESSHSASVTIVQPPHLTTEDEVQSIQEPDLQNDETVGSEGVQRLESDKEGHPDLNKDQDSVDDDDAEEDENYEETVVKPRHLNELTSLTDRTSPWTSILSDPDLVSLESIDTEISHGEKGEQLTTQLPIADSCSHPTSDSEDDKIHKSEETSETEELDTDVGSPRTCEILPLEGHITDAEANSESENDPDTPNTTKVVRHFRTEHTQTKPYPLNISIVVMFLILLLKHKQ